MEREKVMQALAKVRKLKKQKRKRKEERGEKDLPEEALKVESAPADEVYQRLRKKVKGIAEKVLNGKEPKWEIPSRSERNITYDRESDTVLMGKKYKKRKFLSMRSSKKFSMTGRVLAIVSELLKQTSTRRKERSITMMLNF